MLHADRFDPRNPDASQAGTQHRSELSDHQTTGGLHFNDFVLVPKLPLLDWLAGQRITNLDASMIDEIGRSHRPPMYLQTSGCRNASGARLEQLPRDKGGLRRRAESYGDIESHAHQIPQLIPGNELERQVGIEREEFGDMRCEQQTGEKRI